MHAGYWPFQADLAHTIVSADYLPDAPLVANATANYRLFVSRLQESKVCMFDSTVIRKSIAKFYEAFLAGCVVASDLPYEMEELYRWASQFTEIFESCTQQEQDTINAHCITASTSLEWE